VAHAHLKALADSDGFAAAQFEILFAIHQWQSETEENNFRRKGKQQKDDWINGCLNYGR
jgi:hypothetical protein